MPNHTKAIKPSKPYPEFPLYPHACGRWAKKIAARTHYFGAWDDWRGALEEYQHQRDYLKRGVKPPPMRPEQAGVLTVSALVEKLLAHRQAKVSTGEMSKRSLLDYERVGEYLRNRFGNTAVESLTPEDFNQLRTELSERLALVTLGNEIGRIRVFFNYAFKAALVKSPIQFGMQFDKPSKKSVKREAKAKPARLFTVDELRTLYHAADKNFKAFILLALNGGMGNSDIGQIEFKHIVQGWVDYSRPKTEEERQFPLWPETIVAIEAAKQDRGRLPHIFLTKYHQPWHKEDSIDSPISKEFRKLLDECGLHKQGRGFYALRHTFRTFADGCKDQVAIDFVMGHSDGSMAGNYRHREGIEPDRLQAVVDHVRAQIAPMFTPPTKEASK